MTTRLLRVSCAVALVALISSSGFAATVPLSNLLVEGAEFVSGEITFSNFTYTVSPNGDMPSPENVTITDMVDANGNAGFRLQGAFVDQPGGDATDALLTYTATAPRAFSTITMQANPASFGGPGMASVTETMVPLIDDNKLVVFDFGNGDDDLVDSISVGGAFTSLPVQKDIILHSMGDGAVTLGFVDQSFALVPEPAGLGLLLAGLLWLGTLRRRTR